MMVTRDSKPAMSGPWWKSHMREPAVWISIGFLCLGCGLRVAQYAANASQWLDETMLSTSIVSRGLPDLLTERLAYGQSAPPGMLLASRLAVVAFGPSDLALRLFPFLCSLVTLFVSFRLVNRVLHGVARPIAMALMAIASPLIVYSGQAKQYSSDVAVAAVMLLLCVDALQRALDGRRALLLAFAGFVAVWFSNASPLLLAGASLSLIWSACSAGGRLREQLKWPGLVVAIWGAGALVSLLVARAHVSPTMRNTLFKYWADGFMPMPPWRPAALVWPLQAFTRIFGGVESAGLWYPVNRFYAALSLLGLWSIARRDRALGALLIAPFGVALLAAAAHLYPFRDRLVLFLLPCALLGVAEGVRFLAELAAKRLALLGPLIVLACTAPLLVRAAGSLPPYQSEDIKPVMQHLRSRMRASDSLYVYHGAGIAFGYYEGQFGFQATKKQVGKCAYGAPQRYLEELDQLRGASRAWILFTHSLPAYNESRDILAYLDTIGVRLEQVIVPPHQPFGSYAWLGTAELYAYDLSDPARLSRATAATFPVHSSGIHTFTCE